MLGRKSSWWIEVGVERWRDSRYFELLDEFGGKFEGLYFGFEDEEGVGIVRIIVEEDERFEG